MTNLVFIENGRPVTDSLTVAETFGKRHDNVLRDIKELECSREFSLLNFEETSYKAQNGQKYSKYLITQDGFAFLVMGYTGKEAARFKEQYINEFNRMKNKLELPQYKIPQTLPEALRLAADLSEEKDRIQSEKLALEERIEADRPKVLFADSLVVSKDSLLIGELAKLLKQNGIDIGETRLFNYLRENGYLIKSGTERNLPTQRSMEMKLFEIKVGQRGGSDGTFRITKTSKVTGKGQVYFINHFKRKGETA